MIHLVYADTGDWVALYDRDGKLLYQGHSIQEDELLRLLEIGHRVIYAADPGETGYTFPDRLDDVVGGRPGNG